MSKREIEGAGLRYLANYFGAQADYHRKQANKWLLWLAMCFVAMIIILLSMIWDATLKTPKGQTYDQTTQSNIP